MNTTVVSHSSKQRNNYVEAILRETIKMFGPSVFGLTFSELFSSVFVRAASARIIFWLFGLRVDLETIIIF